ncbi:serine/threonine-protein phosphatase [Actinomadura craniellae]|uniref:Serine/threonine-protein phosphatase n=1 Tax=Actinomadura craniellae TaxID=2231787 RepID=A0A365H7Z4_9ACTN|nr:PP2C family protein-serine/threonine phosphatase [Actinomadura craniellae]RAY15191.1 serine/threonine-protein phosphatase [Actinomadura craniellae]
MGRAVESTGERMLGGLLEDCHLAAMEDLPRLAAGHAAPAGLADPTIHVADLQKKFLVPLPGQCGRDGKPLREISIDVTMAGRAFRNVEIVRVRDDDAPGSARLWVPLLDGTERLGVLGVTVPADDEEALCRAAYLASLIALLVTSKRNYSDTYQSLVRTEPMTLSAEVLWNLMPIGTFANDRVVVSAALEPAYAVGGDAYDYAMRGDTLHLAIFDAMGHDTAAGLTASIAMGACRNGRRLGMDLTSTAESVDHAIAGQFAGERFATGVLGVLDVGAGELAWVNRGHHPPLLLRRGRRVPLPEEQVEPPMGLGLPQTPTTIRYQLEPGDRVLFYTDGIIDAQNPAGERFGLERFIDFVLRREADGLPAPETLRRLVLTILEYQHERLQDDATVLMVEWRTQEEQRLTF